MLALDDLRMIVAVAEGGSLTEAASRLGVSLNAVSRRLMKLEEVVGLRLVERTTRSLALTDAGERLWRRAAAVVGELDEIESDLADRRGEPVGTVRVVLPSSLVTGELLRRTHELLAAHPRLAVQLLVTSRDLPLGTEVDLALVVGPPPDRAGMTARRIADVQWALCAAPSYAAAHGVPAGPASLIEHECLRFRGSEPQETWTLTSPDGELRVVPVRGKFEADDSRVLGDAAYAGLGIGIRPQRELAEAIAAGRLVEVLPGWRFGAIPLFLVRPRGRRTGPGARIVSEVLAAAAQELL